MNKAQQPSKKDSKKNKLPPGVKVIPTPKLTSTPIIKKILQEKPKQSPKVTQKPHKKKTAKPATGLGPTASTVSVQNSATSQNADETPTMDMNTVVSIIMVDVSTTINNSAEFLPTITSIPTNQTALTSVTQQPEKAETPLLSHLQKKQNNNNSSNRN